MRAALLALVFGCVFALVVGEVALRSRALRMPDDLSTYLFQCYRHGNSDWALYDLPPLAMQYTKPDFDCDCAWSGYRWRHHTDAYGGRNPAREDHADVVLLGDSITYGHGVEESVTFSHVMRDRLHHSVMNLGFMGRCPVHYVAMMRNIVLPRRPRVVVTVLFQNDLDDVLSYRTEAEIRHYIETGEAAEARYVSEAGLRAYDRAPRGVGALSWDWFTQRLLVPRAIGFYARRWSATHRLTPMRPPDELVTGRDDAAVITPTPPEHLAMAYTRRAISDMNRWATDAGATLVLAVIPGLQRGTYRRDRMVAAMTREIARDRGVPMLDLAPVLSAGDGVARPGCLLPRDGHLSAEGHARVGRALADFLVERRLLPDGR